MTEPKFMTPAHRRAYLTHLNRCKAMDSYHRALIYTLTAVPALRNNIESCFDFEKDEIKPESLAAGWQTGGTVKLTRFAYNLWNGYSDKSCTPYDLFDCSFAPYMYEAVKLRYPEYTRQLDDMVIDDVRNKHGFATSIDSLNPVNPSPVFAGSTGKTGIDIIQNNIALNHLGKMVDFNFHCGLL